MHPWILEGLPDKVKEHHKRIFQKTDDRKLQKEATETAVQGFPPEAKQKSIHQIVRDIRTPAPLPVQTDDR